MTRKRTLLAAPLAAAALLAAAPAAGAATLPTGLYPLPAGLPYHWAVPPLRAAPLSAGAISGPCSSAEGGDGQGGTGGTSNVACLGSGLVFIGPSIGQIANVMGPTIIGSTVIGSVIVSAGNAVGG